MTQYPFGAAARPNAVEDRRQGGREFLLFLLEMYALWVQGGELNS